MAYYSNSNKNEMSGALTAIVKFGVGHEEWVVGYWLLMGNAHFTFSGQALLSLVLIF